MKEKLLTTKNVVLMGMFGALAGVLMLFEFPLPFLAPSFYGLDVSEVPVLIGTFAMGPVAGAIMEVVKILVKLVLKPTSTGFVGEFANLVISCSMVICYDIRFPELVRRSVLEGKADLFFIPAAWPKARLFHWTLLGQARAVENQIYLCAVNQGGISGRTEYAGNSVLLDPWGNDVCRLGTEEGIAFGEIDTDILQQIRDTIHVFRDRRPEIDVVR